MNRLRLAIAIVLLLVLTITATGCAKKQALTPSTNPAPKPVRTFKVAFVFAGMVNDKGWTQAQEKGRLYLQQSLPDVDTSYVDAVSPEDAELMLAELAEKGNRVIFATDDRYSGAVLDVAKRYPRTVFMVCSGTKIAPNVGTYTGRMYQPLFLAGLVAGKMTKDDLIGYVAAYSDAETIRDIDALALGAQDVNPKARVQVVWTRDLLETQSEKDAVKSLIGDGADIIVQQRDDPSVRPAASERNIHFIGSNGDLTQAAPMDDLVCAGWNWGPMFAETVKAVQAGTWLSGQTWGSMSDHTVDLGPLNPIIPEAVSEMVAYHQQRLLLGKGFVFFGRVKDQHGQIGLKPGQLMTDEQLQSLDWFVAGVKTPLDTNMGANPAVGTRKSPSRTTAAG